MKWQVDKRPAFKWQTLALNGLLCHGIIYFIISFCTQYFKKSPEILLKCLLDQREFSLLMSFQKGPKIGDLSVLNHLSLLPYFKYCFIYHHNYHFHYDLKMYFSDNKIFAIRITIRPIITKYIRNIRKIISY